MTDAGTHPTVALARIAAGDVLADRYELRAKLGQGGMGVVWRALDRELDEEVALKLLHVESAESVDALARFRREVKLARRVTHPNVARTYDLGRHGPFRFFTMELIQGESLGTRMRDAVPLAEALRVAAEVARGLAAAHAQGVVHRDLKPDNVMLAGERVAITDFGIARSESDARLTHGAIVGTPAYMAPEQIEGRGIDGRADVYALGVVLFELVTRKLPFHGDTPFAMAAARLATPPPDARSVDASVPDGVAGMIADALARRREDRPDAQTVAARLDGLRGAGAAPRPATPSAFASIDFGERVGDGRTVRVDALDADAGSAALAEDLSRAIRDAVSTERGVKLATSGGDLVVGGELRVAGARARVRLRLASASGVTLWATRAEADTADPFGLEDSVVAAVSAAVRGRAGARHGPPDGPLRERWEKARELGSVLDPSSTRQALAILEELERDAPGEPSVQSLHALQLVHLFLQTGGVDTATAARAEELALRALDADATLADAYYAVADVRATFGDYRAALRALREALSRAPTFSEAHTLLGSLLCATGNVAEGMQRLEVGRRLSPTGSLATAHLVRVRALLGRVDEVRGELARLRGTPGMRSLLPLLTEICVWFDDRALAAETADAIAAVSTGASWEIAVPLLRAFAAGQDVRPVADPIFLHGPHMKMTAWHRAKIAQVGAVYYARLGHLDEALDQIERAAAEAPFVDLLFLDRLAVLAPLRETPRFAAARALVAARVAELGL